MHHISIPHYALTLLSERGRQLGLIREILAKNGALLVIDMQNAFVAKGAPLHIPNALNIVPNINRLTYSFRKAGGLVCWIQTSFLDQDRDWSVFFSDRLNPSASAKMITALSPGQVSYDLYSALNASLGDMFCVKKRFSPFSLGASDLHQRLKEQRIDTVLIAGTVSNTCCESTARDAMMLNYRTIFLADANAARSDEEHNATLANMVQTFAEVASVDDVIRAIRAA